MKKSYNLTIQQLHDHIQNMIRVYNEYKLDRKLQPGNTYRVFGPGYFFLYQLFTTPDGCQIKVTVGKAMGKIKEEEAVNLANIFLTRLDQIVNGQIVLTADIVNRDVYKSGQALLSVVNLVRLIVAVIAIIMALMALGHF